MNRTLLLPLLIGAAVPAVALPQLHEPGFHGVLNVGALSGQMETNFIENVENFRLQVSDATIGDLGDPNGEAFLSGTFSVDLGWTLDDAKTRISIGNEFNDTLEFDRATRVSLRHDFEKHGSARIDLLHSLVFKTRVYADPYLSGERRARTDQDMSGLRVIWDDIRQSRFGAKATFKRRELSNEASGQSDATLTPQERRTLDREGDIWSLQINYTYPVDRQHTLKPAITYLDRDLDGAAMAQEGFEFALNHFYLSEQLEWGSKITYTDLQGDGLNPLFGRSHNADGWSLSSLLVFREWAYRQWTPNVQFSWAELNSDIAFNDAAVFSVTVGIARRF